MNEITKIAEYEGSNGVVVLDFVADWCYPCKMMSPLVDQMASKFANLRFFKVDVEKGSEIAQKFGVTAVPTLVVLNNNSEVNRIVGVQNRESLEKVFMNL